MQPGEFYEYKLGKTTYLLEIAEVKGGFVDLYVRQPSVGLAGKPRHIQMGEISKWGLVLLGKKAAQHRMKSDAAISSDDPE